MSAVRSVGAYRRLLVLYPKQFRDAYGEDMVAVFAEMLRDQPARRVWTRTLLDAARSVVVQRMETKMEQRSSLGALAIAVVAGAVLVAGMTLGGTPVVFFGTLAVALGLLAAALVYWQSHRAYVEPSQHVHRLWLRYAAAGAALLGAVALGTQLTDVGAPWVVLVLMVVSGWACVAIGAVLGVWHVTARLRAA